MATAHGRASRPLSDLLFEEPFRFDFFQAVRLLERLALARIAPSSDPLAPRPDASVGQDHSPDQEAVRFRTQPSLSFPGSAIVQMQQPNQLDGDESPQQTLPLAEMMVTFMGLTGPLGVLPSHYTSLLLRRIKDKDFSLRDFLDMFHHRVISFFYRTWLKYRLPFAYEQAQLSPATREDLITWGLYCLVGMGTEGLRGRLGLDDEVFLYYGGHFAHHPRSAVVLESILADYFALPIKVYQLQGQWLQLAASEQTVMPAGGNPRGLHTQLGVNLVVGDRVWDIQSKFRVQVGPLTYAQFQTFLPNGDALRTLCQLARTYVGPEFDFDVQLVLLAEEVPGTQTGRKKARLGWNTWMRTRTFLYAADDAIFSLQEV